MVPPLKLDFLKKITKYLHILGKSISLLCTWLASPPTNHTFPALCIHNNSSFYSDTELMPWYLAHASSCTMPVFFVCLHSSLESKPNFTILTS
jgi:hypothetical protein